jgi:hypothetical protein
MYRTLACVLSLVSVGWLLAAPAPTTKDPQLPEEVLKYIKSYRDDADDQIQNMKRRMKEPRYAKQKNEFEEKIRVRERKFYDHILGYLANVRDYRELTYSNRRITDDEKRAIEKAIKDIRQQLNEAIRKGVASEKRQVVPFPREVNFEIRRYRLSADARIQEIQAKLKDTSSARLKADLEEKIREQERWFYDKAVAFLQAVCDDPDKALTAQKLTAEEKPVVADMLERFIKGRDNAISDGWASKKVQYEPPAKKK